MRTDHPRPARDRVSSPVRPSARRGLHPSTLVLALACLLGGAACGGGADDGAAAQDTLTERERDSLIGQSRLPGAQGVRGAMRAADSAAARNARLDSIANDNP